MGPVRGQRGRMSRHTQPSGIERHFGDDEIIVSKTDPRGIITYTNDVFQRVSGYSEHELIGAPHSLIRHPDMPRSVFRLLWDVIGARQEIFAYVLNLCRNGDHYWVLAHVTPSFGPDGQLVGYHSNRRRPSRNAIAAIQPVYAALLAEERRHERKADAIAAASTVLTRHLTEARTTYEAFVWGLTNAESAQGAVC